MIIALDDNAIVNLARLFNEPVGQKFLAAQGVPEEVVNSLDLLGFSGIANLTMAIKFSKYYELGENDVVLTVLTDSMELYQSRIKEMQEKYGAYTELDASAHYARYLQGQSTHDLLELRYEDRKRIHNLKYFTWVEQQGKTYDEIMAQWYDPTYWTNIQRQVAEIDGLIEEFNRKVNLN